MRERLRSRANARSAARFTSIIRYGPRDRTHCSVCDFLESPCVPSGRRHAWTPRYYFAVPKSLTQSLIVGSVAFEEAGAHRVIPAPTPPECVTGYLAVSARAGKRSRTAPPLWAVAACTVRVPCRRGAGGQWMVCVVAGGEGRHEVYDLRREPRSRRGFS